MMKKLLALTLAGVMVFGSSICTFAEEAEVSVTWDMIDDDYAEQATWITCFNTFDVMLPSDWDVLVNADLEEGEPEDSVYFQAGDSATGMNVAVTYADGQGEVNFENLEEELSGQFEGFEVWNLNDIPCLCYYNDTVLGLTALGDQGGVYTVIVGLPDDYDDDMLNIAKNIVYSFSATEMEEETE